MKAFGINSLDDLSNKQGQVWRYLTEEWYSLRNHDNENTTRRTAIPLWKMIQERAEQFGVCDEQIRRAAAVRSTDTAFLVKRVAGSVIGLAARKGINDLKEAWRQLEIEVAEEMKGRKFEVEVQRKAIELGISAKKEAA